MRQAIPLLILILMTTLSVNGQVLTIDPAEPEVGDVVSITYHPDAPNALLTGDEPFYLVDMSWRDDNHEYIPMKKTRQGLTARLETYPGVDRIKLLSVKSGDVTDDNGGQYWEVILREDGKAVEGAYRERILLRSRHVEMDKETLQQFSLENIRKEYNLYPDTYLLARIWGLQLELGDDPDGIHAVAREYVRNLLAEDPESWETFRDAGWILRTVDLDEDAAELEARYRAKPPTIEFEASFAANDGYVDRLDAAPADKIEWTIRFLDAYGDVVGRGNSTYEDLYVRDLLSLYVETGDLEGILSVADRAFETFNHRLDPLQMRDVAVAIVDNDGEPDDARRYVRMADRNVENAVSYDVMRRVSSDPAKWRIMYGKEKEAKEFFDRTQAEVDIGAAFVEAKAGRMDRALKGIEGAMEVLSDSEDALLLAGRVQLMAERYDEAFDTFHRLATMSPGHTEARQYLKESWVARHGSDDGYYAAADEIETAWRAQRGLELIEERSNGVAPDFTTMLLSSGETVTRDDLLGKVVIIDFWETWCAPCLASFPDLNTIYVNYRNRDDVVFLVINSGWFDTEDDARSFAETRPYEFPYAMDVDNRMTDAFGVSGIPTTVILDSEGREAFRHIGYDGPDYVAELSLEIDLLLGDYVVATAGAN